MPMPAYHFVPKLEIVGMPGVRPGVTTQLRLAAIHPKLHNQVL